MHLSLKFFFLSNAKNLSIPLLTLCYYVMGYEIASAFFFITNFKLNV